MLHSKKTVYALLAIGITLSGCTAPGTNWVNIRLPKVEDKEIIPADTCLVAARFNVREIGNKGIETARLLIKHDSITGSFYNAAIFDISPGSNFRLATFQPGKYIFKEMLLGGYSGRLNNSYVFECQDQKVTYIGDINLLVDWSNKKYLFKFVDRFDRASTDYSDEYPLLSEKYPLTVKIIEDSRTSNPRPLPSTEK